MKMFIVLAVCIAVAMAAPAESDQQTTVLRSESEVNPDGYKFAYETSDGVSRQEEAELKNVGSENEAIAVRGSISWIAPDGQTYTLNYIADENGFQPEGEHLPKA